jgi:phosphonate transport system substrate-binding protein
MRKPYALRMASCMAPNADSMCRALAAYVADRLALPVELVESVDWPERERMLDAGEIDLCWICGLPYVEKADRGERLALCVAPVMRSARYGGLPVYLSDVVVHVDSAHGCFSDLEGETVGYNEPRSHSGYNILCYHLAVKGRTLDYFDRMVETGSHQASLRHTLSGEIAAAAVDSTVLEVEAARNPVLRRELKAIATLGPSPAPPWVFSQAVPEHVRIEAQSCLADMHRTSEGAAILASWGIAQLRRVVDADYEPIRDMGRIARSARRTREPGSSFRGSSPDASTFVSSWTR